MYEIHHQVLDGGLPALVLKREGLHSIDVNLVVRAGPRYETPETNGLSHLVEHMLFRGTRRYPRSLDFHEAVERIGGPLMGSTGRDSSLYSLLVSPRDLAPALELLSEATLRPTFANLELERKLILEELLEDLDEDGRDLNLEHISRKLLWPNDPVGFSIVGQRSNVERFTVDDVQKLHTERYVTGNALLIAAGSIDPDVFFSKASACFSDMNSGPVASAPPMRASRPGPHIHHKEHDASQVEMLLSFPAPGILHPDAQGIALIQMILGDGVTSRLQWNICEQRGLAYTIDAQYEPLDHLGTLDIDAAVHADHYLELVREVVRTLRLLKERGPTEGELERAICRYRLALEFALDSPSALVAYHMDEIYGMRRSIPQRLETLDSWTPRRLRALCRTLLKRAGATLVTVGPLDILAVRRTERLMHQL